MGEDLQANGVERHHNQCRRKYSGKQHDDQPADTQQGIKALDPGRVELHMGNLGPASHRLRQFVHGIGGGVCRLNNKGVRERISGQAGDQVAHAGIVLHPFQRRFSGNKAPTASGIQLQPGFDFFHSLAVGIQGHEQADLLHAGSTVGSELNVVNEQPPRRRQGHGDADHEQRQRGVQGGADQSPQGVAQGGQMLIEPSVHEASVPWSRRSSRAFCLPDHCGSWVAMMTVTPT